MKHMIVPYTEFELMLRRSRQKIVSLIVVLPLGNDQALRNMSNILEFCDLED
jgi:hypothetical protein